MNSELFWYALQVTPRREELVTQLLQFKGYEPFVPKYKTRRVWSDRIKTVELPLFPGYLFCRFDLRTRLPILTTPGVSFIVGNGKVPQSIEQSEIDALRSVVSSDVSYRPHPYVGVGQRVRIDRGALSGLEGFVTQVKKEYRLIVSVNLLMRSVCVDIDESWVEPLRSSTRPDLVPVPRGGAEKRRPHLTISTQGLSTVWNNVKDDDLQPSKLTR